MLLWKLLTFAVEYLTPSIKRNMLNIYVTFLPIAVLAIILSNGHCISIFLFLYQYHKPVPDTITALSLTLLSRGHTLSNNFYVISVFFLSYVFALPLLCFASFALSMIDASCWLSKAFRNTHCFAQPC